MVGGAGRDGTRDTLVIWHHCSSMLGTCTLMTSLATTSTTEQCYVTGYNLIERDESQRDRYIVRDSLHCIPGVIAIVDLNHIL